MKPAPASHLPEGTPWEKLDCAFRAVLNIPKEALLKEEAKWKVKNRKKRDKKKPA